MSPQEAFQVEGGTLPFVLSPPPADPPATPWFKLIFGLTVCLCVVGSIYLTYRWFLRDVIILIRAKRQRTTEEIGFGTTPNRPGSTASQVGGTGPGG
uniref:Movement protein n=1 Tax=Sugarcane striate virus TaxID=1868659 RepID=A0A411AH69_9GEMI|nr:movement protein [Sugarcane striate virus]QAX33516.1 movement protein [Sugarcane striate virus]QAX33524.1 movement protein [Sugarcane striate virus]QAX33532.1 movement protein [Sugarcane striate virus]QAX33536.1 movement protein [Sugarcane striate virus]